MTGEDQPRVVGRIDPCISGRRLPHCDIAPAFACDVLAGYRRHFRRLLDADNRSAGTDLFPEQATAQSGPAPHVEDDLPGLERERLDDRATVQLKRAGITVIGLSVLVIGRLVPGLPGQRPCRGTRFGHGSSPTESTVNTTRDGPVNSA